MKKLISAVFAILFCFSLSLSTLAGEYTVGSDGNAVYDTAIGYAIHIDDVNGVIEGEDATVINNNISLNNVGSKWAIWFTAKWHADGIYEVITDGAAMGGAIPAVTLAEDEIFVAVHSSSSRPSEAELYPNWEDKVAALAVKKGDFLAFHPDISVEQGWGSGLMLVLTKDEVLAGLIKFPEPDDEPAVSTPDEPASTPDESDAASTPDESDGAGDVASNGQNEPDGNTSGSTVVGGGTSVEVSEYVIDLGDHEKSWFSDWKWVIIGFAAGFVVVAITLFISLKNKKAPSADKANKEPEEKTE